MSTPQLNLTLQRMTRLSRHARLLQAVLLLFLLADLAYSFFQHYHATLDGDMADIILPAPRYAHVLRDPLGLHALLDGAYYGGSNRFMPHWSLSVFYKTVPRALQSIATPLDSVYLAGAIALTGIQAALIYLMSACATGIRRILNIRFLAAAIALTPLFQTNGLNWHIGIISGSPTYSFFYPLASAWLLILFLPLLFFYLHGRIVTSAHAVALMAIPLAWAAAFNGPLNPAVMLIICPVVVLCEGWRAWQRRTSFSLENARQNLSPPRWILYACIAGLVFAALSYVVGRYNIENLEQTISLRNRYAKLPKGIRDFFFNTPAVLILADVILLNIALMSVLRLPDARRALRFAALFAAFAAVYTALLPLGGYRPYRPFIIRADSVQPVILGAAMLYAYSAVKLLQHFSGRKRVLYGLVPLTVCIYFTYWDDPMRGKNYCEREALKVIAASSAEIVQIDSACTIMAWEKMADPRRSANSARLLHYWRVFPEGKTYWQPD